MCTLNETGSVLCKIFAILHLAVVPQRQQIHFLTVLSPASEAKQALLLYSSLFCLGGAWLRDQRAPSGLHGRTCVPDLRDGKHASSSWRESHLATVNNADNSTKTYVGCHWLTLGLASLSTPSQQEPPWAKNKLPQLCSPMLLVSVAFFISIWRGNAKEGYRLKSYSATSCCADLATIHLHCLLSLALRDGIHLQLRKTPINTYREASIVRETT